MMPQISVYASLVLLLSTFSLQSAQTGGSVTVHVMKDNGYQGSTFWFHLSVRVSGGGAWLRGRGCLRNDTCASGGNDIFNAVHIGGRQACVNGPACQGFLFNAGVVDSDQILQLKISRNEAGSRLTINASCTGDDYRLGVSNGHSYSTFQYNQLGSISSSTYQCQRDGTTTPTTTLATTSMTTATTTPTTTLTTTPGITTSTRSSASTYSMSTSPLGASSQNQNSSGGMNQDVLLKVIIPAVAGGLILIVIASIVGVIIRRRAKKRTNHDPPKELPMDDNFYSSPIHNTRPGGAHEDISLEGVEPGSNYEGHDRERKGQHNLKESTRLNSPHASQHIGDVYTPVVKVNHGSHQPATSVPDNLYAAVVRPKQSNTESTLVVSDDVYAQVHKTPNPNSSSGGIIPRVEMVDNDIYG